MLQTRWLEKSQVTPGRSHKRLASREVTGDTRQKSQVTRLSCPMASDTVDRSTSKDEDPRAHVHPSDVDMIMKAGSVQWGGSLHGKLRYVQPVQSLT